MALFAARRTLTAVALLCPLAAPLAAEPSAPVTCGSPTAACEVLQPPAAADDPTAPPKNPPDLTVAGCCRVPPVAVRGTPSYYAFRHVNVVDGGELEFVDAPGVIDFRINALLVEQGGAVEAGSAATPFGAAGGKLLIGLWGPDPQVAAGSHPAVPPIQCQSHGGRCYPEELADSPHCCTATGSDPCSDTTCPAAEHNALFEPYQNLFADSTPFGHKVLGVAYGGSLRLFGAKGVDGTVADAGAACPTPAPPDPADPTDNPNQFDPRRWAALTGTSWARLDATAAAGTALTLDRPVDWEAGDRVVVTATDWHPSHSEVAVVAGNGGSGDLTLESALGYPHRGTLFKVALPDDDTSHNPNRELDLRAAVGLLSRDVVIRSLGPWHDQPFPAAAGCGVEAGDRNCYFGGHVIVRQGFADFQLQGVELYQLGQGGRMGHYPIHFHLCKSTGYTDAFVEDSSIWESNNRFVTLHGTHDVTLARNVGYLSVGHGFYLEDASEIDNLLCQNLAVSARATTREYLAAQEPGSRTARFVPPILDSMYYRPPCAAPPCPQVCTPDSPPCKAPLTLAGGDQLFPSLFWIMNGYNEFVGNMAVGAHGWGACYWLPGAGLSGASLDLSWTAGVESSELYAGFNSAGGRQAPLKRFRGNSCSTAAYALMTELASVPPKAAPIAKDDTLPPPLRFGFARLTPLPNVYTIPNDAKPRVDGNFNSTKYGGPNPSCNTGERTDGDQLDANVDHCVTTVIDRFVTSFNWSEVNLGSVWLRPKHYLFVNSALTDQLFGGLGFVSGGSWDQAPPGYFSLTRDSVFVGTSQPPPADPSAPYFASRLGPRLPPAVPPPPDPQTRPCNPQAGTRLDPFCYFDADGTGIYTGGFNPKRLITIYDGPFFAEGNVFLDTSTFRCKPGAADARETCGVYLGTNQPFFPATPGSFGDDPVPVTPDDEMEVVDAAVGWKQPNGFYYPPAFAFIKSAFGSSDPAAPTERHNVFDQTFRYVQGQTFGAPVHMELAKMGVTPIDFTTILNDLDGTLTGMVSDRGSRTASLSRNRYYDAPAQAPECLSFGLQTSPYDQVTTNVAQLKNPSAGGAGPEYVDFNWGGAKPAVPIYRQLRVRTPGQADACTDAPVCDGTSFGCDRAAFMMGTDTGQAPYLTADRGVYYLDTFPQPTSCIAGSGYVAPGFAAGGAYVAYHLFARPDVAVTYQLYVGTGFDLRTFRWVRVFPHRYLEDGRDLLVEAAPAGDPDYGTRSFDASAGVLTVTLDDSTVAGDFAFGSARREEYEKCIPRDLCRPDAAKGQCVLCNAGGTDECLQGPPEADLEKTIAQICESWVTVASGSGAAGTGTGTPGIETGVFDGVYLADCPAGGCLGFRFALPGDFRPKVYSQVLPDLTVPDCFPADDWEIQLELRPGETACGAAPPPPDPANFCSQAPAGR